MSLDGIETDAAGAEPAGSGKPSRPRQLLAMHRTMVRIRQFEERVKTDYLARKMPGFTHSYVGEEAVAAGGCAALEPGDLITSTHRGHGHAIAKGVGLGPMMAELYGKVTGTCAGRGGSMHIADFSLGMLGANGIVGGGFGLAAGAALAATFLGRSDVTLCFFGDGAINKGTFHEAMNFTRLRKLAGRLPLREQPVRPVHRGRADDRGRRPCRPRRRLWHAGRRGRRQRRARRLCRDEAAADRARRGEGPSLIVADTYRYYGHNVGEAVPYRSNDEVEERRQRDPIAALRGMASGEPLSRCRRLQAGVGRGRREVEEAVVFALAERRARSGDGARRPLFRQPRRLEHALMPYLSMGQATNDAMRVVMRVDPSIIVLGLDIRWGGSFGQFRGLYDEFGERVIDMPISELIIVAAAVGAATRGLRPVVSMSFVEFSMGAMDELVNQAAKLRYMFGGQTKVPLVLRCADGTIRSAAAQHSESLEALFAHVPGLKVVAPSDAYDAKGLLIAAIADDNPVIYLENKKLQPTKAEVPEGLYEVPLGKAAIRREGSDVTIVAYSIQAANGMRRRSSSPRTGSARKSSISAPSCRSTSLRCSIGQEDAARVVCHEAWTFGGFGAEVAAEIQEALFDVLEAPVLRVGARHAHIPFAPALERAVVPAAEEIVEAARQVSARPRRPEGIMKHPVIVPSLGLVESVTVTAWTRASGDPVSKGETIVTIETEKSEVEIESPADGVLEIAVVAGPELVSADLPLGFVDDGAA